MLKYLTSAISLVSSLSFAVEGFENQKLGSIKSGDANAYGSFVCGEGHALIDKKARSGKQALRIAGGEKKTIEFKLVKALSKEGLVQFWAERWTGRAPFEVIISARDKSGKLVELERITKMGTGGYNREVMKKLPLGTQGVVIEASTPEGSGLLVDDFVIGTGKLKITDVQVKNPGVYPIMKRASVNAVGRILVKTTGVSGADLKGIRLKVSPASSVASVNIRRGNENGSQFENKPTPLASAKPDAEGVVTIKSPIALQAGDNHFWIDLSPSASAKVGSEITVSHIAVHNGKEVEKFPTTITQEVGMMLAFGGEDVKQLDGSMRRCGFFRIPGMIRSSKGTLVAVFDARYRHGGDLCADIDVAAVRSTDGGQTWTLPEVAMDTGEGVANGCGDPCILEDAQGRIWVQALTTHFAGGASLSVSKAGNDPKTTGQWNMTYSSDDGKTWKRDLVNPTKQIKKDEWTCILAGPGNGITLKDGTIVFPAQIWQNGAKIRCRSTICYSKDGGKNWVYGEGVPHSTSECQVVELADGSIMINARNEARSGYRVVYTTKDLGKTWQPHESNLKGLREPVCQASLISVDSKKYGKLLLFSNPKSGARNTMTIRYSKDEGKTWSEGYLYDVRGGAGYSSLAMVDENNVGVVYESSQNHAVGGRNLGMSFLIIPLEDIMRAK